jgi:8-oxo-dGTP diphosphatase
LNQSPNKRIISVACVILIHNNEILLARRKEGTSFQGLLELPGGKREPGETWIETARRELLEELSTNIINPHLFMTTTWENTTTQVTLVAVTATCTIRPTKSKDHTELLWIPLSSLKTFLMNKKNEITKPDIPILEVLSIQNLDFY